MRRFFFTLVVLISGIAGAAVKSRDYNLKLVKISQDQGETIYRFTPSDILSGETVTLSAAVTQDLRQKLNIFERKNVGHPDAPLFYLQSKFKQDLDIQLQFTPAYIRDTAIYSCFQDWYLRLSREKQLSLIADLRSLEEETVPDRVNSLNQNGRDLQEFISEEVGGCALRYNGHNIPDNLGGGYLFTGFQRWFNSNVSDLFKNFPELLNGIDETFDSSVRNSNNMSPLLTAWISGVYEMSERPNLIDRVGDFFSAPIHHQADFNRGSFALGSIKYFGSRRDIEKYFSDGDLSSDLKKTLFLTDRLIESCFGEKYLCRENQDLSQWLTVFYFNSKVMGSDTIQFSLIR